MFRPMRRYKQQLPVHECIQVLKNEMRGVLAVIGDDDYPYTIPLSFYYSEDDNKIYFHGAGNGHKIDAIKKCDKASFCVLSDGVKVENKIGLDFKSVVVFGRIKILDDREKTIDICKKLSEKFNYGNDYIEDELRKFANIVTVLELTPEQTTGKLVNES